MKRVLLLPSVLVALILLLASCGDGANATPAPPPEAQAIRVSYRTSAAAWNTGNVDRFLAGYTDQGVLADWGAPREAAREFLSEFIGSIPVKVVKINSIEVFGDRATVDVVRNIGAIRDRARESLVKEGGKWRVDGSEKLSPQLPSGATAIDLKYVDYGFEFKAEATSSGEFALKVENVGKEPHEMLIYELPTGVSLESIFPGAARPTRVEIDCLSGGIGARRANQRGPDETLEIRQLRAGLLHSQPRWDLTRCQRDGGGVHGQVTAAGLSSTAPIYPLATSASQS